MVNPVYYLCISRKIQSLQNKILSEVNDDCNATSFQTSNFRNFNNLC